MLKLENKFFLKIDSIEEEKTDNKIENEIVEKIENIIEPDNIEIDIKNIKPITINSYYKKFKNRLIISKEGQQFNTSILNHLKDLKNSKVLGPIKVDLEFHFTDRRIHDLDNLFKPIIDILKNIVFEDDKEIYEINARKKLKQPIYRILIKISKIIE